jgi:hypothetical protein
VRDILAPFSTKGMNMKLSMPSQLIWVQTGPFFDVYQYLVPDDHDIDDLLGADYFWNARSMLKKGTRIEYFNEAATLMGTMGVLDVDKNARNVRIVEISTMEKGDATSTTQNGVCVEFAGRAGWRVVDFDQEVLIDKLGSKSAAIEWVQSNIVDRAA